jgi:2-oxoglutarate decarboxylase
VLRGAAAAVVKNMSASLEVPTATSVRAIPAKLMIDNRIVINNHLKRTRGGKISFTHLIGYAIVQAVKKFPNMNRHFADVDGKPNAITPAHTNLGLAIDLQGKEGTVSWSWRPSRSPTPCGSASSSPPTRTSCGGPATAS